MFSDQKYALKCASFKVSVPVDNELDISLSWLKIKFIVYNL